MIMPTRYRPASIAGLTVLLVTIVLVLAACRMPLASHSEPPEAHLDPPPGTYSTPIDVEPVWNDNARFYWSEDPSADVTAFTSFGGTRISSDRTFRYYAISPDGLRSTVATAEYVIHDEVSPVIERHTMGVHNRRYYSYWVAWDVVPDETDDTGTGPAQNPWDDITGGWDLEYALYSSAHDDIATIETAATNGTAEIAWIPYHELHSLAQWGQSGELVVDESAGFVAYRYHAGRPGERRSFNVFVRDEAGNTSAYGTRTFSSMPALSVYAGDPTGPDYVHYNPGDDTTDNPDLSLSTPHPTTQTRAVAMGDLNGDLFDDLAIIEADTGQARVSWQPGNGDGSFDTADTTVLFSETYSAYPRQIEIADFSGDGRPEIICNLESGNLEVWTLEGNRVLEVPGGGIPRFELGDVDGDGLLDVVTAGANIRVYLNTSGSVLSLHQSFTSPTGLRDIELGDLNSDGRADLIIAKPGTTLLPEALPTVEVYFADSTGSLIHDETLFSSLDLGTTNIAVADFDGDGHTDLFLGNDERFSGAVSLLMYNNGDGTFSSGPVAPPLPTGMNYWSVSTHVVDINGDGYPDIVEDYDGSSNNPPRILINDHRNALILSGSSLGSVDTEHIATGQVR